MMEILQWISGDPFSAFFIGAFIIASLAVLFLGVAKVIRAMRGEE